MTQKEIADKFSSDVGIMVTWCEACEVWTVNCPECGSNYCGGGLACNCGYDDFVARQQMRLDSLMENK